jgi:hypothetical protein
MVARRWPIEPDTTCGQEAVAGGRCRRLDEGSSSSPIKEVCVPKCTATLAATVATLALAAVPAVAFADADTGVNVCNEAENSPRGGYEVTGDLVDPVPPAFLKGSQMRVGNGNGDGLEHAAERSPALRLCSPEDGGGPVDV